MRALILVALLAAAAPAALAYNVEDFLSGKISLAKADVQLKEKYVGELLQHLQQPSVFGSVRKVAKEFNLEGSENLFTRPAVLKEFFEMYITGMLPRGEAFVETDVKQVVQALRVFRLLYHAKDFDAFIKTACWLRERINAELFVWALVPAVFYRKDCRGIVLPAPYEIYPNLHVGSDVLQRAFMVKMTNGHVDNDFMKYWGVRITDNKVCYIDSRRGTRFALSLEDRLSYFTEDVDLNTYLYYLFMAYLPWYIQDVPELQQMRRGEITLHTAQQLIARYNLERLGRGMCRIEMMNMNSNDNEGYWPNKRLSNGMEIPMRPNNVHILNKYNLKYKMYLDDLEKMLRVAIMTGRLVLNDGTVIPLTKPEDVEYVSRMIHDGRLDTIVKTETTSAPRAISAGNIYVLLALILAQSGHIMKENTALPTVSGTPQTLLRDPISWRLLKRYYEPVEVFKRTLPSYIRKELDFPGVKVEKIFTDKLITFMDEYDMDITNAVMLNESELKKGKGDMLYVARQRRVNTQPFKVSIDVFSDKTVDAVVRVFIGPKFDCMGRLMSVNEKRKMMVEIDSFLYKLETGKNTIVRKSTEMQGVIEDRPMMRKLWAESDVNSTYINNKWWKRVRIGYPHRLVLPLGTLEGLKLQIFAVVTPVREDGGLPGLDIQVMREYGVCRWSTCIDSMPLGFPFDRSIEMTHFYTPNMKFQDITVYRKDVNYKDDKHADFTYMKMRRDDLTYYDMDMAKF